MARTFVLALCLSLTFLGGQARAAGEKLYGVHWWDYNRPSVGAGPTSGWTVETVLTNSDEWQRGWWFEPLYQQVKQTHQAEIITRIDYTWNAGHTTVPAPTQMSAQNWANKILSDIIGPLGNYASRWQIGNEPNILGEGDGWANNQITPQGYAQIYHTARQAIKAVRPNDEVLFAPVSPGGVIDGVRWKAGNEWLAEAVDATLALGGAIDGFAIHAYGDPNAGPRTVISQFSNEYASQLGVIDGRGLRDVPVYMTEWTRATPTSGDLAANEASTADFLRRSLASVNNWNRVPGNHNIRAPGWFVGSGVGWHEFSLQWWRSQGNPEGHPGDLWTAMLDSDEFEAGMVGTRPIADYNSDDVVNDLDWNAWLSAYGRTNWIYADGSRNGKVDAADYVMWRMNSPGGEPGSGAAVPEPGTVVLGALAAVMILCRARARR